MCWFCTRFLTVQLFSFRSNILLDEHLTAKVSDFGFPTQLPEHVSGKTLILATPGAGLPGTPGYQPPAYNVRKHSTLRMCKAMECYDYTFEAHDCSRFHNS